MRYALTTLALALLPVLAHAAAPVTICQANWVDQTRANRVVPVRIRMPSNVQHPLPVILFSHGLGGSLDSGTDWVDAWANAGFITINIQHAGSDSAVWEGKLFPLRAMRAAMNTEQLQARADDVHFVLDRLAQGGHVGACNLSYADLHEIGMSGHSFGAQTTLAVTGGRYAKAPDMRDPRIKAAIALSPQPSIGVDDHQAFGQVTLPFFTVTGTRDSLGKFNSVTAQDRIRPYLAMPAGQKYLLVVDGATHLMLNGQTLRLPNATPPPAVVSLVAKTTTLFWKSTLLHDPQATMQLHSLSTQLPPNQRVEIK